MFPTQWMLVLRSIFETNYPGNKFDGIYNLGVMEHFKNEENYPNTFRNEENS